MRIGSMTQGVKALNANATGKMISLFRKDPFVMAHNTGSSREAAKPVAFSAFTARSSPKMPAVFFPATLVMTATSSMSMATSSSKAKIPLGMGRRYIPFNVAGIPYLFPVMRISLPLSFSLLATLPAALSAQTVDFHADVAPIIYTHCTECHRVGEIGPMPLTNYAEVAAYGEFIEYVTSTGYMPPWTPDDSYSHFVGERVLTDDEKATLSAWVAAGKPEGNPADNPGLPAFPEGSQIGTPDMVLSMPEAYNHSGDMTDQYQVFVLPADPDIDLSIRALEVRPGTAMWLTMPFWAWTFLEPRPTSMR